MSVAIDETVLQEITRRIVARFDPDRIILFGSRARGDAREDSDYDLLIVGPSGEPRGRRDDAVYRALRGVGAPIDVHWWTAEEIDEWSDVRSHFINRALRDSRVIYEVGDPRGAGFALRLVPRMVGDAHPTRVPETSRKKMPTDHARMLWEKAANDLVAARAILGTGSALDMVGFHAQQAVEKSLKAILALHDAVYPRTHEIEDLIALAKPLAPDWPFDDGRLVRLTRYAIDVRYEDRYPEATSGEAREAFEVAESVHLRVGAWIGPDRRTSEESAGD